MVIITQLFISFHKSSPGSSLYCVVLGRNVQMKICRINRIGVKGIVKKITSVCTHVSS